MLFIRFTVLVLMTVASTGIGAQEKECPTGDAAAFRYTFSDADLARMKGFLGMTSHGYPQVMKSLRTVIMDQWSLPCDEVNVKDATQYRRLPANFIQQFGITEEISTYNVLFQTHDGGDQLNRPGQRFLAYWQVQKDGTMRLLFNRDADFTEAKLQSIFRVIRQEGGLLRKDVLVMEAVR